MINTNECCYKVAYISYRKNGNEFIEYFLMTPDEKLKTISPMVFKKSKLPDTTRIHVIEFWITDQANKLNSMQKKIDFNVAIVEAEKAGTPMDDIDKMQWLEKKNYCTAPFL